MLFIIFTTQYENINYSYAFESASLLDKSYINSCFRQIYLISFPIKKVLESQAGCSLFMSHSMPLVFATPCGRSERMCHAPFSPRSLACEIGRGDLKVFAIGSQQRKCYARWLVSSLGRGVGLSV